MQSSKAVDLDRRQSLHILERRASSAFDLEVELGFPRLSSANFTLENLQQNFHSARTVSTRLPSHEQIPTPISDRGLDEKQAEARLRQYGPNEIVEKRCSKLSLFVAQFTAPMPIGIWIAIAIELGLQAWVDGAILFVLQMMNGIIAYVEESRAGDAIAALKQSLKPTAVVIREGAPREMDAFLLVPGDCVVLSSGRAVPADCVLVTGTIMVDQSAITGESMPVHCMHGSQISMGSTVSSGTGKAMVIATGMNTFFGKTTAMLQMATEQLGELRRILMRVVLVLLTLSTVLCLTTLIFLLREGQAFATAIGYVVVLAVASIPLAMEVVVTATLALGSRQLSVQKAIVADLSAIERLSGISVLCCDKTGTLTQNRMVVQDECPIFKDGLDRDQVLLYAALATDFDHGARDAIDRMILSEVDLAACRQYEILDHTEFDPSLKRTESKVRHRSTGQVFRVAKGAPHTVLDLSINQAEVKAAVIEIIYDFADRGVRCLGVAKSPDGAEPYEFVGMLAFLDPPRPDSAATLAELNDYGVQVKMITGDHQLIAIETCRALRLGRADIMTCDMDQLPKVELRAGQVVVPETLGRDYADLIMQKDGFSSALPEHKFVIVSALKQAGIICGMTGDGVNDAPALKIASVGIAVSGSTDAARAAADIVLTAPGLQTIASAVLIARCIFRRMHAFLVYRIAATLQLLVFFFVASLVLRPVQYGGPDYPPFWSMPVLALIFITVLNDLSLISIAYDNVPVPKIPQTWNMPLLWANAAVLGTVACASSLLLLWLTLDSTRTGSFMDQLGFPVSSFGQIINVMYLKISLSDFLTLFAARTGPRFFWASMPGWPLLLATVFAVSTSTIVAMLWGFNGESEPISGDFALFVWLYCLVWFLIQNVIKVAVFSVHRSMAAIKKRRQLHPDILYRYKSYIGNVGRPFDTLSQSSFLSYQRWSGLPPPERFETLFKNTTAQLS